MASWPLPSLLKASGKTTGLFARSDSPFKNCTNSQKDTFEPNFVQVLYTWCHHFTPGYEGSLVLTWIKFNRTFSEMIELKAFPEKNGDSFAGKLFFFCCSNSSELSSACFVCKFFSFFSVCRVGVSWQILVDIRRTQPRIGCFNSLLNCWIFLLLWWHRGGQITRIILWINFRDFFWYPLFDWVVNKGYMVALMDPMF